MEGYTSIFYSTALSLLPPVVAIVLALLFKEVYSALIAGVIVGAILYSNGNPGMAFQGKGKGRFDGLCPNHWEIQYQCL